MSAGSRIGTQVCELSWLSNLLGCSNALSCLCKWGLSHCKSSNVSVRGRMSNSHWFSWINAEWTGCWIKCEEKKGFLLHGGTVALMTGAALWPSGW